MSTSSLSDANVAAQSRLYTGQVLNFKEPDQQIVEVNGQTCLAHKVEQSDSLMRLSLKYNISERDIKNLNGLFSDQIHHMKHINIPMKEEFKMEEKVEMDQAEALSQEMLHRQSTISKLSAEIARSQGLIGVDFKSEALFYCEENGYDYGKAKEAYDQDRAFEVQQLAGH